MLVVVAWQLSITLDCLIESAKLQEMLFFLSLLAHPRQRGTFFHSDLADDLGYSTRRVPAAFRRSCTAGPRAALARFPGRIPGVGTAGAPCPAAAAAGSREALRADLLGNRLKGTNLVYGNPRLICPRRGRLRRGGEGGRLRSGLARAARKFWQLPGSGPSP